MNQVRVSRVDVGDPIKAENMKNTYASFLRTGERMFCYLRSFYWSCSLIWFGSQLSGLYLRLWTLSFNMALAQRVKEVPLCHTHHTRQNWICRQKAFGQDWLYWPSSFWFSKANQTLCFSVKTLKWSNEPHNSGTPLRTHCCRLCTTTDLLWRNGYVSVLDTCVWCERVPVTQMNVISGAHVYSGGRMCLLWQAVNTKTNLCKLLSKFVWKHTHVCTVLDSAVKSLLC